MMGNIINISNERSSIRYYDRTYIFKFISGKVLATCVLNITFIVHIMACTDPSSPKEKQRVTRWLYKVASRRD